MDRAKLYNIASNYAKNRSNMLQVYQDPEDFALYCLEYGFTGRLSFRFIDFLRKTSGDARAKSYQDRKRFNNPLRLNQPLPDSEEDWLVKIPYKADISSEENAEARQRIRAFVETCNPRAREIIELLLLGYDQVQIGRVYNICNERVSQIVKHCCEN